MLEGTIIKALSGFYYVNDGQQQIQCRARGVFRKRGLSPLVGDHVGYEAKKPTDGYILSIQKRKNELKRPPIANIDQAILVFSVAEPAFDSQLLDRFLVQMEAQNIDPLICLTKWDLLSQVEAEAMRLRVDTYARIGYPVVITSSMNNEGLDALRNQMENRISVITGQSGVGKSTLLNHLNQSLSIDTQAISQSLGRGKHTTRHVELMPIGVNGYVADTPGFSSLELPDITVTELEHCFPEFDGYRDHCRFRGCTHIAEPDCMVKEAISEKKIDQKRYAHYQVFFNEINQRKKY
ncbi:ribosome small subunit-dependent GTPase A [Sporolactobacillus kofuensis]|uniref:Small ribosomal subunit biogenesis GTPase RsgA n=1 Tax=Sporolactobacillus kofuensis TaxID=269672 RepID=A0ABW1WAZ0_9BACL|nr:ribosome small subunit-dependent GTPase A [Sporolactobacillus kofuensis]MCO7174654.1 ribosome small subunit-dependent GTPase A [Sporolactobacillus kofuensis]